MTPSDNAFFGGEHVSDEKRARCLGRLRGGGITNPDEQSCGHICSFIILRCSNGTPYSAVEKRNLKDTVKTELNGKRGCNTRVVPYLKIYPKMPQQLPATICMAMYPDPSDQPPQSEVVVAGLIDLESDYPLRWSHRSLRGHQPSGSDALATRRANMGMQTDPMRMLVSVVMQALQAQDPSAHAADGNTRPPPMRRGASIHDPIPEGLLHYGPTIATDPSQAPAAGASAPSGAVYVTPPRAALPSPSAAIVSAAHSTSPLGTTHGVSCAEARATSHHAPLTHAPDSCATTPSSVSAHVGDGLPPVTSIGAEAVTGLIERQRAAFAARDRGNVADAGVACKALAQPKGMKRPAACGAGPPAAKRSSGVGAGAPGREAYGSEPFKRHPKEPVRPKMPKTTGKQVDPITWFNGKIYVSQTKEAFRTLATVGDKVDKLFAWRGNPAAAWGHALDYISNQRRIDGVK